jgi:F-box protein 21
MDPLTQVVVTSGASFSTLPSELIVRILCYLDNFKDILNAGLTAREILDCSSENAVWRSIYHTKWTHGKRIVLESPNWKKEYVRRHQLDGYIDDTVEKLICPPEPPSHARIPRFRDIKEWDVDMKDRLMHHINCPDNVDDVLARRYWARMLLKSLYRRQAVMTWQAMNAGEEVALERALTTFDLFIRDGGDGDFGSVSGWLDEMVEDFKSTMPEYTSLSTRGQAMLLAHHMVTQKDFNGTSEETYYDIRNNFIGLTLQSPTRQGLPLIYVAIFCALARRIGLDAHPISFPSHVFAAVYPPKGVDLNGKPVQKGAFPDRMFLDLYALTTLEVPEQKLRDMMDEIPIHRSRHDKHLEPANTMTMILRMRRNLAYCVQHAADNDANFDSPNESFLSVHREELMYAILWMTMVFDGTDGAALERRRSHVSYLLTPLETTFSSDWYLFDEVVMPKFEGYADASALRNSLREIRERDLEPPYPKYRDFEIREHIHFKVGTCFTHIKYGYVGFIVGWDSACSAPEVWQRSQRIHELDYGGQQCFYNVV